MRYLHCDGHASVLMRLAFDGLHLADRKWKALPHPELVQHSCIFAEEFLYSKEVHGLFLRLTTFHADATHAVESFGADHGGGCEAQLAGGRQQKQLQQAMAEKQGPRAVDAPAQSEGPFAVWFQGHWW